MKNLGLYSGILVIATSLVVGAGCARVEKPPAKPQKATQAVEPEKVEDPTVAKCENPASFDSIPDTQKEIKFTDLVLKTDITYKLDRVLYHVSFVQEDETQASVLLNTAFEKAEDGKVSPSQSLLCEDLKNLSELSAITLPVDEISAKDATSHKRRVISLHIKKGEEVQMSAEPLDLKDALQLTDDAKREKDREELKKFGRDIETRVYQIDENNFEIREVISGAYSKGEIKGKVTYSTSAHYTLQK